MSQWYPILKKKKNYECKSKVLQYLGNLRHILAALDDSTKGHKGDKLNCEMPSLLETL